MTSQAKVVWFDTNGDTNRATMTGVRPSIGKHAKIPGC